MTSVGIDEIINKLSSKFNRIFYDREFVGSVSEDLQAIIENENKCVLVFPALSPNYLRVVRYQAKLFDLAVIALGSGSARSVGVCHKKYFLPSPAEPEKNFKAEELCTKQMAENAATSTRRKRPPIQLYVPPAQRRSRLSETSNLQKEHVKSDLQKESSRSENNQKLTSRCDREKYKSSCSVDRIDVQSNGLTKEIRLGETNGTRSSAKEEAQNIEVKRHSSLLDSDFSELDKEELQNEDKSKDLCLCTEDIDYVLPNKPFNFPFFSYQCNCMKFLLFKDTFPYLKLLVFSIKRIKHSFHCIRLTQKTKNILEVDDCVDKWSIVNIHRLLFRNVSKDIRVGILGPKILDFRETKHFSEEISEFQNRFYSCGNSILFEVPRNNYCCYLPPPQYEVVDDDLKPQDYLHNCQNSKNESSRIEEFIISITSCIMLPPQSKVEDLDVDTLLGLASSTTESPQMPCEKDETNNCDNKILNLCAKPENANELISNTPEEKKAPKVIDKVIVLDDHMAATKTGSKSPPRIENKAKHNEHEQEKEIMRKAKQNINRKTRPIIKYVDDDNDTLKIGKGDNVNNWEDLFNDDGELQEDIFTEIIQKVGPEVTIVKATEDYSAYASKQVEELEHMVELYDFPATLETHDIISAFSMLNSDSMYVKWVDDTRALLVLGSSIQAQKAIELSNSLIKVRPMSAASSLALEKAHQSDLKPAMKRPQTNLQTARRLITSHLGAKSKVSKEQSAKEREDLRVAKEMKKQAKQNEKDAWEGNLRSAIN